MASIMSEAQAVGANRESLTGAMIEIVVINGGPVSQLERRTLPGVVSAAVADLQAKGMDIALAGTFGDDDIDYHKFCNLLLGRMLCCFIGFNFKEMRSLHDRKGNEKTTLVFLRTYDADEYFKLWDAEEMHARWTFRKGLFYLALACTGLYWLMASDGSTPTGGAGPCRYENDGECDDPTHCTPGTDMEDCCGHSPPLVWAQVTATGARCNATTCNATACIFE